MEPAVSDILQRLASEPAEADRFFAAPGPWLDAADVELSADDRAALLHLDRDALLYLADADRVEPPLAPEHPASRAGSPWVTPLLVGWGCVAFVLLWLWFGGGQ